MQGGFRVQKAIKNELLAFIICDYGVEKKKI
jgi:hypothetical protein